MSDERKPTIKSRIIKYSILFFVITILSIGGWYLGKNYYDVEIKSTPKDTKKDNKDNPIIETPKEEKKYIEEKTNPDVNDIEVMNLITKLFPNYLYDSSKEISHLGFESNDLGEFVISRLSDQDKLSIALETMDKTNIFDTLCSEITEEETFLTYNNQEIAISCGMSLTGNENTLSTKTIKSEKFIKSFKKIFGNEEIINIVDFKHSCNTLYHYNKSIESYVAYNALSCDNNNIRTSLNTVKIKEYTNKNNTYKITIELINNNNNEIKEYMITYKLDTTANWYIYSTQKIK